MIGAVEGGADRQNQTGGQLVDGAGRKAAHRGNAEKDSGLVNAVQAALNGAIASGDYAKVLNRWGGGVESIPQSEINPPGLGDWTGGAMSEAFRDISPRLRSCSRLLAGCLPEYAARYGDYFLRDAEVELSEWYVPPQGLFIVLEREGRNYRHRRV